MASLITDLLGRRERHSRFHRLDHTRVERLQRSQGVAQQFLHHAQPVLGDRDTCRMDTGAERLHRQSLSLRHRASSLCSAPLETARRCVHMARWPSRPAHDGIVASIDPKSKWAAGTGGGYDDATVVSCPDKAGASGVCPRVTVNKLTTSYAIVSGRQ